MRASIDVVQWAFPQVEPANNGSAAFHDAVCAYLRGDCAEALACLRMADSEHTVPPEAACERLFLRCLLGLGAGEFQESARAAEEMIRNAQSNQLVRWAALGTLVLASVESDRGHLGYAQDLLERAYSELRAHGKLWDLARCKFYLGLNSLAQGRTRIGEEHLEAGLHLARVSGSLFLEAIILNRLGVRDVTIGRYDSAAEKYDLAEQILRTVGAERKLAQLVFSKTVLSVTKGDLKRARSEATLAYELYYENAGPIPAARWKQVLGWLELRCNNRTEARALLSEALEAFRRHGAQRDEALTYEFLGDLAAQDGNRDEAQVMYHRGLDLGRMTSVTSDVVAECLRKLGELHAHAGELREAVTMARAATKISKTYLDRLEVAALHRLRGIIAVRRGRRSYGIEFLHLARAEFASLPARIEVIETESMIRGDTGGTVQAQVTGGPERREAPVRMPTVLDGALAADGVMSRDPRVVRAHGLVMRSAPSRLPVLILGETGSGKELLAAAVHRHSGRTGPYLTINCAALPPDILDGELFGSARGAFTGAIRDRAGLVEAANDGTLFLDEVGEMSPAVQGRLLRAIELGEVRRLGENRTRKVNTRFVSATHRDLERMVQAGEFRADLFFRLRGIVVVVPPLRERVGDVDLLTDHFLLSDPRGASLKLSPEARESLRSHAWPGNVRELKSVLERVIELSEAGATIHPDDLGLEPIRVAGSLAEHLEEEERRRLIATLESLNWNRSRAAKALNMKRTTFLSKLRRLGITGPVRR